MDNITVISNYLQDKLKRGFTVYRSPIEDAFAIEWAVYDSSDTKVIGAFTHRIPFKDLLSMTDPIGYAESIMNEYLEDRKNRLHEAEPLLQQNDGPIVWDLVVQDMRERDKKGYQKYHTHLQPFNGRDALIDAYQEALDLVVCLRQLIYEREMENDGS